MVSRVATAMLLAVVLVPAVAAALKVKVAHDPDVDFTKFHTYAWNEKECLAAAVPEIQDAIVRSVESQLEALGLRKVALADADLQLVTYAIGETLASAMGGYYHNPGWNWAFITSDARVVTRGALVIDLRDPGSGRPVWHAVAEKTISDPNTAVHIMDRVTEKMFAGYPVRPNPKKK